MVQLLAAVAQITAVFGLLFNIISLGIPYWIHLTESINGVVIASGAANIGLWLVCGEATVGTITETECLTIDITGLDGTTGACFNATRALMIMGMLAMTVAVVCGFIRVCCKTDDRVLPAVASGFAFVAGSCMMLGAIAFGARYADIAGTSKGLHAGFALAILAAILSLFSGTFFIGVRRNA